ncbi:unnamed protein product [Plutella xylostella]|uniref:(diamondback moth) hypothetical protein n=1 Tax=Plutella xylostella TaxID=51655 RepID=A0A8S4G0P8_PLUXY|nr:unnamed protein product [Plutella xylostella]
MYSDSTDQYYSALQTTSPVLHTLEQGILVVTLLELANNSALRRPGGLDSFYLATMGKVDPAVTKPYPYVPGFLRDLEDADPIRGENFTSEVHNENKSRRHIRNTALPSSITNYFDTTTPGVLLPKVTLDTKLMFPEPDGKTDDSKKDQILKTLIDEYGNASMTKDSKPPAGDSLGRGSWPRKADNVKIEFGFGVPLGAMAAHPAFHSAWDMGW